MLLCKRRLVMSNNDGAGILGSVAGNCEALQWAVTENALRCRRSEAVMADSAADGDKLHVEAAIGVDRR